SIPPISSTIRSDPSRISSNDPELRVMNPLSSGRSPVRRSIRSACDGSMSANARPTVPWPSSPTRKTPSLELDVTGGQVLVGFAAHDHPGFAVSAEDHRGTRDAVVVVGQRITVSAGDSRGYHFTRGRVGQSHLAHDHISGLAVLAGDPAGLARA